MPRFDRLCEDWLAILSRDMPVYDALEHLIAITGFNLMLYFLERGKAQAGDAEPVEIVCEMVSRERTKVRALSGRVRIWPTKATRQLRFGPRSSRPGSRTSGAGIGL